LAGRISPLFLQRIQEMGWTARTDVRDEVLPLMPWGADEE
jgi:hypothetical protein